MSSKNLAGVAVSFLVLGLFSLFVTPGCGSLDKTGVYAGDKVLYDADLAIGASYQAIDGFLDWEMRNRGTASCPPAATKAADDIRASAPKAFATAMQARDTYKAAKTAASQSALDAALVVLQNIVSAANNWLPNRTATLPK